VSEKIKPEEKLRRVRARAQTFFEQLDAKEAATQPAAMPQSEASGQPLSPDQLNLFLRSLNSQLRSAIAEVKASSKDLADLAAEVKRVEARLGQRNQ